MRRTRSGKRLGVAAGIALGILSLLSGFAQAQSIAGTWTAAYPGGASYITFQGNGQWSWLTVAPEFEEYCGGSYTIFGTYTASGGAMSMPITASRCGSDTTPFSATYGSGTYSVSANTLQIHLTGGLASPIDLFLTQGTVTSPTTPLPDPQAEQTVYSAPGGRIPASAVQVEAAGTFGTASLSVLLDIVKVLQTGLGTGLETSSHLYNVYVVALVPGQALGSAAVPVWFVKPQAPGNWRLLQWPLSAFLQGVNEGAADNQVLVEILVSTNVSSLVGTEFYIGYGLTDQEMLAAGRFRGVFKAQPQ